MDRRNFLGAGLGTILGTTALGETIRAGQCVAARPAVPTGDDGFPSPLETKLNVKPVMANLIHTDVWEGPCRWRAMSVGDEKEQAKSSFARWSKELRESKLGQRADVVLLDPVHITFSEDFVLGREELDKLKPAGPVTDVVYVHPAGSSIAAYEIGDHLERPILLKGLGCRNVDIAAYTKSRGNEALVAADEAELHEVLSVLRARKVFRQTRVLFPTDRGLPAVCSVGSIWDLDGLQKRLGVSVKTISYAELAGEMSTLLKDSAVQEDADQGADRLLHKAEKSYIEKQYVVKSLQFHRAVKNVMHRHGCNAFTIECFEFCSSRLPEQWQITPCLIHSLFRDRGHASSCEGDLGSLLAMRMLMSVAHRSCHQGNSDPRSQQTFRINHSVPSLRMNGFDQPELPYQLGRFVSKGWGTKAVVDFMNNDEKTVTVARVDPTATKLLVLRGELVGAGGWGRDNVGCSVEAVIKAPEGRLEEFLKRRLEYGNHLQWVYGDYTGGMRQLGTMLGLDVEVFG